MTELPIDQRVAFVPMSRAIVPGTSISADLCANSRFEKIPKE
jgi:hypothetical protein